MSAISGWEGKVYFSNRIFGESVGTGNDVLVDFDLDYPAVDELGDVTDTATKIEVFIDGVLQTPTTDYTLDGDGGSGSVGQITFISAPATDEVITANYYAYQEIEYIQSVSLSNNNNVTPVHQIGLRPPVELKEGNIEIGLSMTRCLIDLGLLSVTITQVSEAVGWLASNLFDIEVYPKGTTATYPLLIVRGKFNTSNIDIPQDGILMQSVDFTGLDITSTTAS